MGDRSLVSGERGQPGARLPPLWIPAAADNFNSRARQLVEQFNQHSPLEGMTVNGKLTLGENIGDLGGLEMAYSAYQLHQAKHGEAKAIDGYTSDQRFFMAWAQGWRHKVREGALAERLVTDPHSPAKYRVNGVVRNMDAWYHAFDIGKESPLYLPPSERVSIW